MAEAKPFASTGALFDISQAFAHSPDTDRLFNEAMHEALRWHLVRCRPFRDFLIRHDFLPGLTAVAPEAIPPLFVTIFKEHRLVSVPDADVKIELTSSGTGGQRTAIILDHRSYRRILKLVDHIFGSLDLVNRQERVNYLCFTFDPKKAGSVGTAFSDKIVTGLTGRRSVFYALRWNDAVQDFQFDLDATVQRLLAFAKRPEPVRILGFPAYLWQVCNRLERLGKSLYLGPRSFVITGGGWKIHKDQEVTKTCFKERVASVLGLPAANIRDSFGLVEHGIPYVDCEHGNLHVPIYARARIVDPESLRELPEGTPGLLHLMTPYLSSYPSISLLTTDRAIVRSGCPCGRKGRYIEILGRAGLAKHKGCAITALDYLEVAE